MLKRSFILAVITAAVALGTGFPAHASVQGQRHFHKGWILQKLGLDDTQKQQAREIFGKHRPQIKPIVQQLVPERRALRNLMQADTVDELAIRTQSAKVTALKAELAVQRAYLFHDLRVILTPDQLQKFKELQAKRDQKTDRFLSSDADQNK